ncbi:MAG: hypothetical protein JW862_10450 [Anaerolineales bacterium]|nr:hypothetical protein [Anaerolineales bacterium]
MTTWRRKISEYEADLHRVEMTWLEKLFGSAKGGEIEIEQFDDGEMRMELDLYRLKCPDGARVAVLIDGRLVQQVETRRGYVRLRLTSVEGAQIPQVQSGSTAEIQYQGEVLMKGSFRLD